MSRLLVQLKADADKVDREHSLSTTLSLEMIGQSESPSRYRLMARAMGLALAWLVEHRLSTLNAGVLMPFTVILIQRVHHAAAYVFHSYLLLERQHPLRLIVNRPYSLPVIPSGPRGDAPAQLGGAGTGRFVDVSFREALASQLELPTGLEMMGSSHV